MYQQIISLLLPPRLAPAIYRSTNHTFCFFCLALVIRVSTNHIFRFLSLVPVINTYVPTNHMFASSVTSRSSHRSANHTCCFFRFRLWSCVYLPIILYVFPFQSRPSRIATNHFLFLFFIDILSLFHSHPKVFFAAELTDNRTTVSN